MNAIACLAFAVSALAAPVLSFAQTADQPLTRAQVRADLTRVEQAGYDPHSKNDTRYPADVQAAEAKIAAQPRASQTNDAVGGMSESGTSNAGMPIAQTKLSTSCVGPASFCNPYFGN